ncbi:MAG: 50S ribosome-binding GTPase [Clostridia bacterium]|nr:50S ribosome-binding GTPase [Clostridia bacterium]
MDFFRKNRNNSRSIDSNKLKKRIAESGIPAELAEQAVEYVQKRFDDLELPIVALIGAPGVGKSSTINALFNAGVEIGDVRATTKVEKPIVGDVSEYTGSKGSVIIYDMPGLGEDIFADQKHLETYIRVLPYVDVAVWVFQAGYRAMTPMQEGIMKLTKALGDDIVKKFMFAINKADCTNPGEADWNTRLNIPSQKQQENIEENEKYILEKIQQIIPSWKGEIVTYSAKRSYRLEQLVCGMIEAMPSDGRFLLGDVIDTVDPLDQIDPQLRTIIEQMRRK